MYSAVDSIGDKIKCPNPPVWNSVCIVVGWERIVLGCSWIGSLFLFLFLCTLFDILRENSNQILQEAKKPLMRTRCETERTRSARILSSNFSFSTIATLRCFPRRKKRGKTQSGLCTCTQEPLFHQKEVPLGYIPLWQPIPMRRCRSVCRHDITMFIMWSTSSYDHDWERPLVPVEVIATS